MKSFFAVAASIVFFFSATSAHALTIDLSTLDTMRAQSKGPFGLLNWFGVELKVTTGYNGKSTGMLEVSEGVSVDSGTYLDLDQPQKPVLSRIVKGKNGEVTYERAELLVAPENPVMQITAFSSVRLREVARVDAHVERAKTIAVYAYRSDAKHVVVLVDADGSSIGKRTDGPCAQNGQDCTVDLGEWHDHLTGIPLGADRPLGQARGNVVFDDAPKGETNQARTYIVNASFTQTSRDPEPVVAITTHTIETVFQGDGEE